MRYSDSEVVYIGRDNTFIKQLLIDKVPADLTSVSRMVLTLTDGMVIDSAIDNVIDWTLGTGKVEFDIGRVQTQGESPTYLLAAGDYMASLVIYDDAYPDGLVWTEEMHIVVKSGI